MRWSRCGMSAFVVRALARIPANGQYGLKPALRTKMAAHRAPITSRGVSNVVASPVRFPAGDDLPRARRAAARWSALVATAHPLPLVRLPRRIRRVVLRLPRPAALL